MDHRFLVSSFSPACGRSSLRARLCNRHAHGQAPGPGLFHFRSPFGEDLGAGPRPRLSPVSCSFTILSSIDVVIFNPCGRCRVHRGNILMLTLLWCSEFFLHIHVYNHELQVRKGNSLMCLIYPTRVHRLCGMLFRQPQPKARQAATPQVAQCLGVVFSESPRNLDGFFVGVPCSPPSHDSQGIYLLSLDTKLIHKPYWA